MIHGFTWLCLTLKFSPRNSYQWQTAKYTKFRESQVCYCPLGNLNGRKHRKSLHHRRKQKTTENFMANMKEKNIAVFPQLYLHSVYKVWVQGIQIKCLHFYTEQGRILPVINMWYNAQIHPLRSGLFKFKALKSQLWCWKKELLLQKSIHTFLTFGWGQTAKPHY